MTTPADALITRIHRELDAGLIPSCQIAWARHGEIEHFETFGDSTNDTDYVIFSATKAIVASLVWVLIGEGLIDVDRPVVDYIPEFGTHRKDIITVEQVMLHTSGFPHAPMGPGEWNTHEGSRRADGDLATQLGTGIGVRVPREFGPLGPRRDHRPGDRR